jgi:putative membrane protein
MRVIQDEKSRQAIRYFIIAVSIIIPLVVALLFKVKIDGYDFTFLPPIYATINGLTGVLLVAAVMAIKKGNKSLHETLIKVCMIFSAAFLVMYVLYHMTSESTSFGGEGAIRYVYFIILITHILLSIVIVPLILFSYMRAWFGEYEKHRTLVKYTFPLWLYVAVSGVIVYIMISPYYQH